MGGKSRYRGFFQDCINERLQAEQDEQRPKKRRATDAAVRELGRAQEIGVDELRSADRSWAESRRRTQIGYVLVRRLGYPLTEVSRYLKHDAATVGGASIGRLVEKAKTDDKLRRVLERLTKRVSK